MQPAIALAEPYRVDGDPVSAHSESVTPREWKRPKRVNQGVRKFTVAVELPRQTMEVWSHSAAEAEWEAWHMIGCAGVRHFGHLEAIEAPAPALPAVTHTGQ